MKLFSSYKKVTVSNLKFQDERFDFDVSFTLPDDTIKTQNLYCIFPGTITLNKANVDILTMIANLCGNYFHYFTESTNVLPIDNKDINHFFRDLQFNEQVNLAEAFDDETRKQIPQIQYVEFPELENYNISMTGGDFYVSMSGGNESTLTYAMLKELIHSNDVLPVWVREKSWKTSLNMYNRLGGGVIETNFAEVFSMLPDGANHLKANIYVPMLVLLEGIWISESSKTKKSYLLIGDEYDCSERMYNDAGMPYYGHNYDQSHTFKRRISELFKRLGKNIEVFSIIEPLYTTPVVYILNTFFPEYADDVVSCFTPELQPDGKYRPCNKCNKCARIAYITRALGMNMDNMHYKFQDREITQFELFNSYGTDKEFANVNYLTKKLGLKAYEGESKYYKEIFDVNSNETTAKITASLPSTIMQSLYSKLESYEQSN